MGSCSKNVGRIPYGFDCVHPESFNLIRERLGPFKNSKKINYQGFNFLKAIFTISAGPREKPACSFIMLKNLARWLMVLLKVKRSLWWQVQELMSESFEVIVEEPLLLKNSMGTFLGRKGA